MLGMLVGKCTWLCTDFMGLFIVCIDLLVLSSPADQGHKRDSVRKHLASLKISSEICTALRAPPGHITLNGPHVRPSSQDLEHHFGSAMPHPSCSDALGVSIFCPVSVLPLAGQGPQLVSP